MKSSTRSLVSLFLFVSLIVSSFGLAYASGPSFPSELYPILQPPWRKLKSPLVYQLMIQSLMWRTLRRLRIRQREPL